MFYFHATIPNTKQETRRSVKAFTYEYLRKEVSGKEVYSKHATP